MVAEFIRALPRSTSDALEQVEGALRYGTLPEDPQALKEADKALLVTERLRLMQAVGRVRK